MLRKAASWNAVALGGLGGGAKIRAPAERYADNGVGSATPADDIINCKPDTVGDLARATSSSSTFFSSSGGGGGARRRTTSGGSWSLSVEGQVALSSSSLSSFSAIAGRLMALVTWFCGSLWHQSNNTDHRRKGAADINGRHTHTRICQSWDSKQSTSTLQIWLPD